MTKTLSHPESSALSNLLASHSAKSEATTIPLEILFNLQYQHSWRDLQLHALREGSSSLELVNPNAVPSLTPHSPRSAPPETICLISGLPPRHSYLHPDFQAKLIRHQISEKSITVQREWVLPMSLGEKWTLKRFCRVFDALPGRDELDVENNVVGDIGEWKDAKRMLMGMLSTNGMGGDGTVVYYIMQEGEVKPRQNG